MEFIAKTQIIFLCMFICSSTLFLFVGAQETQAENPLTAGGGQCLAANEPCEEHHQCCEHRCTDNKCFACLQINAECRNGFDCCSKRCEMGKCLRCKAKGEKCFMNEECCEKNCSNGGCGGIILPELAKPPAPAPVHASGGGGGQHAQGQGQDKATASGSKMQAGEWGILILTIFFAFSLRKLL